MKTELSAVWVFLLVALLAAPANCDASDDSGITVRVHVPHEEPLANEQYQNYVVRIENRGHERVPLLTDLTYWFDGRDEPVQSRLQTQEEAAAGTTLPVEDWEAIMRQAQPTEFRKEASMLDPGMAIELCMGRLPAGTLPNGESRIAIQTGPKQFSYSNWVELRVLPKVDSSDWPVVSEREINVAPIDLYDYIMDEGETGQWLFARSKQNTDSIWRVCRLPDGEIPVIENDWSRHQSAIVFSEHPQATCYYNTLIGVARSTPWPSGANANDLMGKFIPIDATSPLGFPMELFADAGKPATGSPKRDGSSTRTTSGADRSPFEAPTSSEEPSTDPTSGAPGNLPFWIWITVGCVFAAVLALILLQAKKRGYRRI